MPELPEVETIARSLQNNADRSNENDALSTRPGILGRVVSSVSILWERSLAQPSVSEFESILPGKKIQTVGRRGKYLVIQFDNKMMLIHLRMSGDIRVEKTSNSILQKHDRMVMKFLDGWQLVFTDPRKFGRIWLVDQIDEITSRLGMEPLSEELTGDLLIQKLHSTTRRIKPLLLDQSVVAGLGNIYTDEALFLASIHPLTPAREISPLQVESLLRSIRFVLAEGIRRNGASIDWVYRGGDFQNHFNVYQRTGEPCRVCGARIERIVVGQRGTHYCPHCQSIPVSPNGNIKTVG